MNRIDLTADEIVAGMSEYSQADIDLDMKHATRANKIMAEFDSFILKLNDYIKEVTYEK